MQEQKWTNPEELQTENEFLKMKLMLERGAVFGSFGRKGQLPAEIENHFLRCIEAFESQFEKKQTIRFYDKIDQPVHFRPVAEIPEDDFESAWMELTLYLRRYGIKVDTCYPKVDVKELYRFTVEELFEAQIDDLQLPMTRCFMYEEYHPDPGIDATGLAIEDCLKMILHPGPLEWMHFYRTKNLQLNQYDSMTQDEIREVINQFKSMYDDIVITSLNSTACILENACCLVKGNYNATATANRKKNLLGGNWEVYLDMDADLECWFINRIVIEGIDF